MPINYELMQANRRAQKSGLTRALNCTDSVRRKAAVLKTCTQTVQEWNECGGVYPDDWIRWSRALTDNGIFIRLEDPAEFQNLCKGSR